MSRLFYFMLLLALPAANGLWAQDHYQVYVMNNSNFKIICEGMPEKGGGVFTKYTSSLMPHKNFLFGIEPNKSPLPRGVEGTIKFRLEGTKYNGYAEVYFDNPAVGSTEFKITSASYPFSVEQVGVGEIHGVVVLLYNASSVIKISVDTSQTLTNPQPLTGTVSSHSSNTDEPIPPIINFDWEVQQRMKKDKDDDNNGKAYNEVTYFFTSSGDYAAVKPQDKSFSLMIYSKKGHTWLFDDKKKTITVMGMAKTVSEGAMAGKQLAEKKNKTPLKKDKDEELSVQKTGNTKNIAGYTANEYAMKGKAGAASYWYATVPFDPVKIYTMGAGRPADMSKIQHDPKMKNNPFAISLLNKNYLWVEASFGAIKGMETTTIKKVNNTINTAGYKIKVMNGLKDLLKSDDNN